MRLFQSPSKYPFGINISDHSIAIVQLFRHHHSPAMQTVGIINMPNGFIINGEIKNKDGVIKLIKNLKNNTIFGKITTNEAIAALPEKKTFVKLIKIRADELDLADAIQKEIERQVPYEITEINYDWKFIKQENGIQHILVGVAPKAIADEYHDLLIKSGITPVAFEPENMSIVRCVVPYNAKNEKTTIILNIGDKHSNFIAYAKKSVLFTVSVPMSEKDITDIITQDLKIMQKKTEKEKITANYNKERSQKVVNEMLETKIRQAFDYLNTNYPQYAKIGGIYLCGGGSVVDLPKMLADKFNAFVEPADVFVNLKQTAAMKKKYFAKENNFIKKIAKNNEQKQDFILALTAAIGLALRGFYHDDL